MPPPKATSITLAEFNNILSRYESTISAVSAAQTARSKSKTKNTKTLSELDGWRRSALPEAITSRMATKKTDGQETAEGEVDEENQGGFMEKSEVEDLVYCKLKRGKFRPTLPSLIASNVESSIKAVTAKAFSQLSSSSSPLQTDTILEALSGISTLRGVGPATASYVLAAHSPSKIPVFSDEGYRWVFFEDGAGKGWDRKLKYDEKEYNGYITRVWEVAERLSKDTGTEKGNKVTAEDVEKVGFVLGKTIESGQEAKAGEVEEKKEATNSKGKKRKTEEEEEEQPRGAAKRTASQRPGKEDNLRRSQRNRRN